MPHKTLEGLPLPMSPMMERGECSHQFVQGYPRLILRDLTQALRRPYKRKDMIYPRQMFTGIRENISPVIAAVATLLTLFTTALMMTLEWLRGRRK